MENRDGERDSYEENEQGEFTSTLLKEVADENNSIVGTVDLSREWFLRLLIEAYIRFRHNGIGVLDAPITESIEDVLWEERGVRVAELSNDELIKYFQA